MKKNDREQLKQINVEAIWATTNFDEKRLLLLQFISNFRFPKKAPLFNQQVNRASSIKQLDNIALNLHMAQEGLCKIR